MVNLKLVLKTLINLIKEYDFSLKNTRSRRYTTQTITDLDYADDTAFLANTPTLVESLLSYLEQAACCIGLHVNAEKTKYMWFNEKGDISTLNHGSLKPEDKSTYLVSKASSTENDINIRLVNS